MKGESCSMKRKKYTIGLIILAVIAVIGAAVVFSGHNCDMMNSIRSIRSGRPGGQKKSTGRPRRSSALTRAG